MVRTVDYQARRSAVLARTIKKYIKDAAPVSSEELAPEFDLSAATIRNIFADLEEGGYLTHPYTSGGRIPTNKGYRYYVDFLIAQMELLEGEKESIIKEYKRGVAQLEDLLERTSGIISAVTHYTGITSFLKWQDRVFYKGLGFILELPEFQNLAKMRYLVKMLEEKQHLLNIINREFSERVKIYIGQELDCPEMEGCSLVVSTYGAKNKPMGKLAVLGPMRMEYEHIIPTLEYISETLTEVLDRI